MTYCKSIVVLLLLASVAATAQQSCRKVVFSGDVQPGQAYRHAISSKLAFVLQPTATGWRIEVQPVPFQSPRDAAEVATPPYQSVSPLLLTTDYTFRSQDVVSWNPREFEFATDPNVIANAAQDVDLLLNKATDPARKKEAETRLIALAGSAAHGELKILDSSLVPGTADQSAAAAAVAAHWRTTAHTLVQPKAGAKATPSGTVESLRFQVTLWMPANISLAAGMHGVPTSCPR
jgi:hypothetical protein